nr:MLX-interacting protein-like isoform X1 [Onthophagus taurus]
MYVTENTRKMESPGNNKEAIHSGHFMVSHFEAEAQDDDDTAVPIPDIAIKDLQKSSVATNVIMDHFVNNKRLQPIAIENGLSTLFQCMSIAYRQKLTSPKWNRFRGIRLRWKDKIRLNNVIWRCWHMQFIRKQNTLICQFASPLDVDTHNKPEAIVLEGKYWKRKLAAVTAEYKKWRMFYKTQSLGHQKDANDLLLELELLRYDFPYQEHNMLIDEDYMGLMSDTLFSTISNQPFAFPDTREIAKAGLSHFIQPSLGPLQPNLPNNDLMDFEGLDILSGKLPTVPEEPVCNNKSLPWNYPELDLASTSNNINLNLSSSTIQQFQSSSTTILDVQQLQTNRQQQPYVNDVLLQQPTYSVISKSSVKSKEKGPQQTTNYPDYQMAEMSTPVTLTVLQLPQQTQQGFKGYKENYKKPNPVPGGQSKIPQLVKEEKVNGMRSIQRVRRSRSNTREPLKRVPPLQSAVSDPSLISPANNIILSQLLTNSSESLYRNAQTMSSTSTESIRCKEEQSIPSSVKLCVTSPVIISPINMTAVQKSSEIQTSLSPPASIIQENPSLSSPTSPHGSLESLNREPIHREQRRAGHIHAEQKRRYNIKNGFDVMYSLIPPLNQNPNAKLSKAAMLQKGAEYIVQLRNEREQLKDEMDSLRQQIDSLTTSISNCQCLLPATGAPISSKKRDLKMQEMFDEYVRIRTNENWKFWIFSLLFKPLLGSFNNFVSTASLEDLYKTTFHWVEQHCALGDLRPIVFNSLKYLCTKTEILLMPDKLPEEARSQVGPSTTNHADL